jgi:SpoIID/LytB domain protein
MSQYGALGRAQNGKSARQILTHYYSGVRVRKVATPDKVRVGLLNSKRSVKITSLARPGRDDGGRIEFRIRGARRSLAAGGPGVSWTVEPTRRGRVRLLRDGTRIRRRGRTSFGSPSRPLVVTYVGHGTMARLTQKRLNYAYGRITVATHSTPCRARYCLRAVLSIRPQRYLLGLGEVPASWPRAALKAQVIAARTYALERIRRLGQHRFPCDCALYDSAVDQVYSGDARRVAAGRYWRRWRRAVGRTDRQALLYRGGFIQAYYSSSSGGHTENNENVWGGDPIPYLRGVSDRADSVAANPNHRWRVKMRWRRFARKLDAAFGIGKLRRVQLVRPFGVSGRVTVAKSASRGGVRVVGSRATRRVDGWDIRSALDLRDTWFRIRVVRTAPARAQSCERSAWKQHRSEHPSEEVVGEEAISSAPLACDRTSGASSVDGSGDARGA